MQGIGLEGLFPKGETQHMNLEESVLEQFSNYVATGAQIQLMYWLPQILDLIF